MVGLWGYHQGDDGVRSNKTMKTVENSREQQECWRRRTMVSYDC
jgi:hypothetical protein